MRVHWFSRRGSERRENSDAAAIGRRGRECLAIVVDGAEKGGKGAELARHWANTVLGQALAEPSPLSQAVVNDLLKTEHARLRHDFLHDIACYCLITLNLDTLDARVWHCGDCLVGLFDAAAPQWLTPPHILALQSGLRTPSSVAETQRRQQTVTRSLNAKRFCAPDTQEIGLQHGQSLILCTDGYWRECFESGVQPDNVSDDASLLTLTTGMLRNGEAMRIDKDSDVDNLEHFRNV